MKKRRIPVFATDAEEVKWWYDSRDVLADDMVAAIREDRLGEGSKGAGPADRLKNSRRSLSAAKPLEHSRSS